MCMAFLWTTETTYFAHVAFAIPSAWRLLLQPITIKSNGVFVMLIRHFCTDKATAELQSCHVGQHCDLSDS